MGTNFPTFTHCFVNHISYNACWAKSIYLQFYSPDIVLIIETIYIH